MHVFTCECVHAHRYLTPQGPPCLRQRFLKSNRNLLVPRQAAHQTHQAIPHLCIQRRPPRTRCRAHGPACFLIGLSSLDGHQHLGERRREGGGAGRGRDRECMRVHAREWAVLVGHSRGRAPTRVQFPPRTQEPTDSQSIKRAPPTTAHAHASAAPVIWTQFPAPCPADPKTAVVCSLAQAARPWLLLPWPSSVIVCVHACMHACMTYAWVCVSICICMCVHVYTHTCISIHLPPPPSLSIRHS